MLLGKKLESVFTVQEEVYRGCRTGWRPDCSSSVIIATERSQVVIITRGIIMSRAVQEPACNMAYSWLIDQR